jgi:hypothetical protein
MLDRMAADVEQADYAPMEQLGSLYDGYRPTPDGSSPAFGR